MNKELFDSMQKQMTPSPQVRAALTEQLAQPAKKRPTPWMKYGAVAACAALVLLGAGGGGLVYSQSYAVASVVSLDVNPSIELKVNRGERVISCTALNTEAAAVLFNMGGGADLVGTKLDVAVNAIVGALVREGYLDSVSSAILISVEDKDQARAQRLQAELVASVDGVLKTQAPGTSVLSQVVDQGTLRVEYGNVNNISSGKAALVEKVERLNQMAGERGQTLAEMALCWNLRGDNLNTVLIGASRPEQIENNVKILAGVDFSEEELKKIDEILAK